MTSANHSMYRKDIDGLRAIAVIAVIIHHLDNSILPGGYIGVDIFFVISGFLITSHIFKGLQAKTFSFASFYKKRINRIVPVLVVVIMFFSCIGYFLLSPADLIRLGYSAQATMLGFSNIYFWREYGNYFAGDASEAILLHTWSLGVEEQFYLFWPVLLVILFSTTSQLRYMLGVLIVIFIGALVVSIYGTSLFASASYYLMPSRVFEFMVGALPAIFLSNKNIGYVVCTLLKIVGFILIFYGLWLFDAATVFPSYNALIPSLGTALIIIAGNNGYGSRLLAMRPLYGTGLISYSMYLWHWPIIAYFHYLYLPISLTLGIVILLVTYLLSFLSWKYIELPFRAIGNKKGFLEVFIKILILPLVMVIGIVIFIKATNGISQRFPLDVYKLEQITLVKPNELRVGCHVTNQLFRTETDPEHCLLGEDKDGVDGILIGDSYANHFSGMIDEIAKNEALRLFDYTMDACPPILNYTNGLSSSYAERCIARNNHIYEVVKKNRYQYLLLAANWPNSEDVYPYLDETIAKLSATGAKIVIVLNNQVIGNAATCYTRKRMFNLSLSCEAKQFDLPTYWQKLNEKYPALVFINPNLVMCKDNMCASSLNGIPLYRDNGHLNDVGARLIGEEFVKQGVQLIK